AIEQGGPHAAEQLLPVVCPGTPGTPGLSAARSGPQPRDRGGCHAACPSLGGMIVNKPFPTLMPGLILSSSDSTVNTVGVGLGGARAGQTLLRLHVDGL